MSADFPVTVYHNRACGTSRNTLAMVRAAGYDPVVVDYLQTGWTRALLDDLVARMAVAPADLLREKGTPAVELGLLGADGETILAAMVEHPILVNRPIVVTPKGAALCRPSERVFDLLERSPETFTKEDGEVVVLRKA